jgi:hypothetical protein
MKRFASIAFLVVSPAIALAQRTPRELTLDASILGGSVAYAIQSSPGRLFGVQVGAGGDFFNRTVVGGSHFRDNGGDNMFELVHLAVFHRRHTTSRMSVDAGLRLSSFAHGTDGDDDVGIAGFAGLYAMPMFALDRNGRFSIGPRILAGVLSEGSDKSEFGVNVAAFTGRVTFGR